MQDRSEVSKLRQETMFFNDTYQAKRARVYKRTAGVLAVILGALGFWILMI